ncbi:MAG: hypothetical protein M5U14_17915 [Acidimicrobiia bacterium]|nr:hypothetical protein [Acidimicrobiia bacterium]
MTIVAFLILVVLWAAVLIQPALRGRVEGRRADSIGDFHYRLGVLGRTGGHAALPVGPGLPSHLRDAGAPGSRAMTPAQRRRRDVLVSLLVAAGLTLLLAVLGGGSELLFLHLLVDGLLAAYVGLLVRMRRLASERRAKVRYLPQPRAPQLALRRTASS